MLLKEGLPADDFNQAIMNSRMRKKASPHFAAEERPAIKTRFVKAADAASPASCVFQKQEQIQTYQKAICRSRCGDVMLSIKEQIRLLL
ncbi:MAG: hypothetical protein ACTTKK_09740 [Ottowia sp.]